MLLSLILEDDDIAMAAICLFFAKWVITCVT
jgi:hypothetical protein